MQQEGLIICTNTRNSLSNDSFRFYELGGIRSAIAACNTVRLGIETFARMATKGVSSAKVSSGRRFYRAYSFTLVRHGHGDDFSTQRDQETPTPRRGPSKEMRVAFPWF